MKTVQQKNYIASGSQDKEELLQLLDTLRSEVSKMSVVRWQRTDVSLIEVDRNTPEPEPVEHKAGIGITLQIEIPFRFN